MRLNNPNQKNDSDMEKYWHIENTQEENKILKQKNDQKIDKKEMRNMGFSKEKATGW